MDEMMEAGWPYRFCDTCCKLAPIAPLTSRLARCTICNEFTNEDTAGRTVYLSIQEARVRGLDVV